MATKKWNWAVVGTGAIVRKFLVGLRWCENADVYAVASRRQETADAFAAEQGIQKAYGALDAMLADPAVEIVYIGTPHPAHKAAVLKALRAGKAVLCEKPVGINAGEMTEIIECARQTGGFFMEAMWPRFMPAMRQVRHWLSDGMIGPVQMVSANFGFSGSWDEQGRLLNPHLGGGALLDVGVYSVSFASMAFGGAAPQKVQGMLCMSETGVDEQFMGTISYGGRKMASVGAAITTKMVSDGWIYGAGGRIQMPDFVFGRSAILTVEGDFTQEYHPALLSNGYPYEAQEVMRCLEEGKTESDVMPWQESLQIIQTMDQIRAQNDFVYPFERPQA